MNPPDLNLLVASLTVRLDIDVDWEMGIDVAHLVLVTLGHTNDHVVDECPDSTESSNRLAATMMQGNIDRVGAGLHESDVDVLEVFLELAPTVPSISNSFKRQARN